MSGELRWVIVTSRAGEVGERDLVTDPAARALGGALHQDRAASRKRSSLESFAEEIEPDLRLQPGGLSPLNPKTALFFLAFLPQFVHPEQGSVVTQLAALGFVFVTMSAVYNALIAFAAGHVAGWVARHPSIGRWQGRVIGTIYLGLGVRLALQEK